MCKNVLIVGWLEGSDDGCDEGWSNEREIFTITQKKNHAESALKKGRILVYLVLTSRSPIDGGTLLLLSKNARRENETAKSILHCIMH